MKNIGCLPICAFLFILGLAFSLVYNAKEASEQSLINDLTKPGEVIAPHTFNNLTVKAQKFFMEKGGVVKETP